MSAIIEFVAEIDVAPPPSPPSGVYGYHGRLKDITATVGSAIVVANQWAAEAEKRGTTVVSSTWTYSGAGTLTGGVLAGSRTTALLAAESSGVLANTVTLANGEVLIGTRRVIASDPTG